MRRLTDKFDRAWNSDTLKWTLIVVVALMLGLDYFNIQVISLTADVQKTGTLGDWVAGVGTCVATVAALYIASVSRTDMNRREAAAAEALRSRVFVWYAQDGAAGSVIVSNQSASPLYCWRIDIGAHGGGAAPVPISSTGEQTIQPGTCTIPLCGQPTGGDTPCTISFIDISGDAWSRDSNGALRPLDELSLPALSTAVASRRPANIRALGAAI